LIISDESVQKIFQKSTGSFPWLNYEAISENCGDDVLHEIEEILSYIWSVADKYGKNQSVAAFGKRCRKAAKEQYPFLEERTIDLLAASLEYNYWK